MYIVTFKERYNSSPLIVHNPFVDGVKLIKGDISQGVNNIDSFDLEIDYNNQGYTMMKPMTTLVEVRNIKNNDIEFTGRLLNYVDSMDSNGLHTKTGVCEGALGYLHDSYPPYMNFSGSPENLFKEFINQHNAQVEDYKKFQMGVIDLGKVIDRNGNIISGPGYESAGTGTFITPEKSIFDNVKTELIDEFGGEIQIRHVGSLMYVDYVKSIGRDSLEDIGISKNLVSVTKKVDPSNIVTRLIPLGKTISTEAEDDNEQRTTISSVNNGKIYIDRLDLINEFGVQMGSEIWDDVEDPSILKTNGIQWLNEQKVVLQQFTVDALDLFKIGKGIEEYIVGNTHKIVNPIMGLNERIRIVSKRVDIVNPINSSLTIGDKFKTLVEYQRESRETTRKYATLQGIVKKQGSSISTMSTQIMDVQTVITNSGVETLPEDLQEIDTRITHVQNAIDGMVALRKHTTTIGDDTTVTHMVFHNFGTRDVMVSVRGMVEPYGEAQVNIEYTSVNSVTIRTGSPIPSSAKLSVSIFG